MSNPKNYYVIKHNGARTLGRFNYQYEAIEFAYERSRRYPTTIYLVHKTKGKNPLRVFRNGAEYERVANELR